MWSTLLYNRGVCRLSQSGGWLAESKRRKARERKSLYSCSKGQPFGLFCLSFRLASFAQAKIGVLWRDSSKVDSVQVKAVVKELSFLFSFVYTH